MKKHKESILYALKLDTEVEFLPRNAGGVCVYVYVKTLSMNYHNFVSIMLIAYMIRAYLL